MFRALLLILALSSPAVAAPPTVAHAVTSGELVCLVTDHGFAVPLTLSQWAGVGTSPTCAILPADVEHEIITAWTDATNVKHEVRTYILKKDTLDERAQKVRDHKLLVDLMQQVYPKQQGGG